MDNHIEIRDLSKTYKTRDGWVEALNNINLTIKYGEFVSLVGPSGCGKSTLLQIVAGLIPSSKGTVIVDGKEVRRPITNVGIVFQEHLLLDWYDVLRNVLLQIEMRNLNRTDYKEQALWLLKRVGLDGFETKYPYELSGGMRQRVSVCRALVHDPPLLFMDEPFGALDALTRDEIGIDLEKLWLASKKTVLFVTHSISEAIKLSDRIVVMTPRPGRIEEIIEVDLPRPRGDMQFSEPFNELYNRIFGIFRSKGFLKASTMS
ncbi:MAG: ABC transporter ATP-binding protein [Firmicutes bacterium]|nr:ABC transporter ATP-binding protein [Bacillota bacterium]